MSRYELDPLAYMSDYCQAVGVMPYIPGKIVLIHDTYNVGENVVYSNTDPVALHISHIKLTVLGLVDEISLKLIDDDSNEAYNFFHISLAANKYDTNTPIVFPIPFEVRNTYSIVCSNASEGDILEVSLFGYYVGTLS